MTPLERSSPSSAVLAATTPVKLAIDPPERRRPEALSPKANIEVIQRTIPCSIAVIPGAALDTPV